MLGWAKIEEETDVEVEWGKHSKVKWSSFFGEE